MHKAEKKNSRSAVLKGDFESACIGTNKEMLAEVMSQKILDTDFEHKKTSMQRYRMYSPKKGVKIQK